MLTAFQPSLVAALLSKLLDPDSIITKLFPQLSADADLTVSKKLKHVQTTDVGIRPCSEKKQAYCFVLAVWHAFGECG